MRIKKFVISNITLSIILITVLYGLSWFYINYVNDRTVKFMEYNKLSDNSVDIVTLGSSHGKFGIKLDKKNQMSLSLESQRFYYDFKMLEKYEKKLKEGAVIIIPLSIFSFYENEEFFNGETYKNYINLLRKNDIRKKIKNSEYFLTRNFSILYPPSRLIETLKYLLKEKMKKNYIYYGKNLRGAELKKAALETAKGHSTGLKEEYKKNGINSLNNILNYSHKRRYRAIFVVTPYWYGYTDELERIEKNIFENKIYKNLKKIEKLQKREYIFLDYSHDKRFINNEEFFMDDDHLNEKGAEYFTEILLKDIEKELKNEREI
ncbi:hypothetical protein [uncultured Fusobacterium sp.]|uniref:hypothetical protein n=1 Tax=uncultured Fusobacterium sp. TaxID=159267 RepID=UPI0025E4D9D1|nr:hypothetical protein [uncultured Fusobacterium sp.]